MITERQHYLTLQSHSESSNVQHGLSLKTEAVNLAIRSPHSATVLMQLRFPSQNKIDTTSGRPISMFENGQIIDGIVAGYSL